MPDNDYIILYDETGQPYIEHIALKGAYGAVKGYAGSVYNAARAKAAGVKNYGVGRGVRVNHKYIAKIGNRYIYDAKELAAAKAKQAKGAVSNVAKNAKGAVNRNAKINKKERKPLVTLTMTDGSGNKQTLTNGKAIGTAAKIGGKVAGAIVKQKSQQKVDQIKGKTKDAVDAIKDKANDVKDFAEDVSYNVDYEARAVKDYVKAKSKAKKYKKEAARLNEELTEARRANDWKDTPETEALKKKYMDAMERANEQNKQVKRAKGLLR